MDQENRKDHAKARHIEDMSASSLAALALPGLTFPLALVSSPGATGASQKGTLLSAIWTDVDCSS